MKLLFLKTFARLFGLFFICIALGTSCSVISRTSVVNAPNNKPFVFANQLILHSNVNKDEKNRLTNELNKYWDDSLKVRKIQKFGLFYRIKNPAIYDSANIGRSIQLMNAYLNSQGYYYASFSPKVKMDTSEKEIRAQISMEIAIGKNITIDSVAFDLTDTALQKLTLLHAQNSLLKKGTPYTKQIISSELDRLVGIYRQNGYFKFTREDIYALIDTTDSQLLKLTFDPFKQAEFIQEAAQRRKENPSWDITILRRDSKDSTRTTQFHIGRLFYYPETKISDNPDSILKQTNFKEITRRSYTLKYHKGLFTNKTLREHTYLTNGEIYNENNYLKTLNNFGQTGAWQQIDGKPIIRGKDSLDVHFFLVPAIKQNFSVDLEGSRNTADIGIGNLWGLSTNFNYQNKNIWKSAIQSLTKFRTGVELSLFEADKKSSLQTFIFSLGQTYVFPKLIIPFTKWRALNKLDNKKTVIALNGSYVDRKGFYQMRSLIGSLGYEWKYGNNVYSAKPLNLELYAIDTLDGLKQLFISNPFLQSSFNSGKIISQSFSLVRNISKTPSTSHFFRLGIEEAGGLSGLVLGMNKQIYRYVKVETEYRHVIKFDKTEFAMRGYAGLGYNYGSDPLRDITLPFFKQFSAGGPNSMRAWGLRQLGIGRSTKSEADTSKNSYRDRFGDMQLEANLEYRFLLTKIAGVSVGSTLFADIGNIWNLKKSIIDPDALFSFHQLGKDLAIAVGTGLRIDFSYFLIRLDAAYKLKDPARPTPGGWTKGFQWFENRANGLKVNNYAIQLGIGLPF